MCSMVITSSICHIKLLGGWPIAMEAYGIAGLAFLIVWQMHGAYKPRHSSYVTATELAHIREKRLTKSAYNAVPPIPVKKILLSPCVIVMGVSFYAQSFIVTTFITYIPMFNHAVLKMDLLQNGITSAMPFFMEAFSEISFSFCEGIMKRRGITATTTIKFFSTIAIFGAVTCIIPLSIVAQANNAVATVLLALTLGFLAASSVACNTVLITIAPQFTQFVNTYAHLYKHMGRILSPILVGALAVKGVQWQAVFYLLAVLCVGSVLLFLFFAHGRREIVVQLYERDAHAMFRANLSEQMAHDHQLGLSKNQKQTEVMHQAEETVVLFESSDILRDVSEEFTSSEE